MTAIPVGSTIDTGVGSTAWDPSTRDHVTDGAGNYERTHWVDQAVAFILGTKRGSLKSLPDHGNSLGEIKVLDARTIQADVDNRQRIALASLLEQPPKIELISNEVDMQALKYGQLRVATTYRNLLTGNRRNVDNRR